MDNEQIKITWQPGEALIPEEMKELKEYFGHLLEAVLKLEDVTFEIHDDGRVDLEWDGIRVRMKKTFPSFVPALHEIVEIHASRSAFFKHSPVSGK